MPRPRDAISPNDIHGHQSWSDCFLQVYYYSGYSYMSIPEASRSLCLQSCVLRYVVYLQMQLPFTLRILHKELDWASNLSRNYVRTTTAEPKSVCWLLAAWVSGLACCS
ncbi:hypothetical protein RJZ90_006948 [Blastomyces dermatitidis]